MRGFGIGSVPNRQSVSVQQWIGPRGQGRLCRGPLRSTLYRDREWPSAHRAVTAL